VLCLFLLRNACLRATVSPLAEWLWAHLCSGACPTNAHTARGVRHRGGHHAAGVAAWPMLAIPHAPFKERDFLIHWIADPAHRIRKCFASSAVSVNCVPSPGLQFGAHIGQAFLANEIVGVATVRMDQHDPMSITTKTLAAIKECRRLSWPCTAARKPT